MIWLIAVWFVFAGIYANVAVAAWLRRLWGDDGGWGDPPPDEPSSQSPPPTLDWEEVEAWLREQSERIATRA